MSAELDPTVAKVLDKDRPACPDDDDDREDELLDELEADTAALDAFREKRMQQLHDEMMRARQMRDQAHGGYAESTSEKEILDFTTSTKYTVVHFFHPDFRRCRILDTHLSALAPRHFDTRFARIHVERAPFLVERLKVVVLPCLMSFVDGRSVDRIEGFAELGNTDGFSTAVLERRLLACGVLQRAKVAEGGAGAVAGAGAGAVGERAQSEDEDGDDWD